MEHPECLCDFWLHVVVELPALNIAKKHMKDAEGVIVGETLEYNQRSNLFSGVLIPESITHKTGTEK